MYNQNETFSLVTAQSSKSNLEEILALNNYPIYDNCLEVFNLIDAQSSKSHEIDTKTEIIVSETYREDEVYSLMNNCYDPRNFGKVIPFVKKAISEKKPSKAELFEAIAA